MKRDADSIARNVNVPNPHGQARSPREESGIVSSRESRTAPRVRARLEARLSTLDPHTTDAGEKCFLVTSATTLDVADGGLRLESDGLVTLGERVVVELALLDGTCVERRGTIAWTREDATGAILVGVRFDESVEGLAACATRLS